MVAQSAHYDHDYPGGEDEENDEEQRKEV
jgi:hypothetical protein